MTWDSYHPLATTPRLEFTDEFDLLMGDSLGRVNDDGSYTSYHIANISDNQLSATLWNYTDETFETASKDELRTWRKNDTPIDAVLSIHQFTVTDDDGTPVGIKLHGSAMQSKETIRWLGRDSFSYCLRVAISEGERGSEITEPYYADESVRDDDYYEFETEVRTTLHEYLKENTPLTEEQTTDLLNGVMETFEHNAEHRVGVSEAWDLPDALRDRRTEISMNGNPDALVRTFINTPDCIEDNETTITYHPLTE